MSRSFFYAARNFLKEVLPIIPVVLFVVFLCCLLYLAEETSVNRPGCYEICRGGRCETLDGPLTGYDSKIGENTYLSGPWLVRRVPCGVDDECDDLKSESAE